MHKFIFEKKQKNLIRYKHEGKLNNLAVPVAKGTISIMLNTEKKNQNFALGQTMTETARFQLKWKTIQWLMNNKREAVENMVTEKKQHWYRYSLLTPEVDYTTLTIEKAASKSV